MPVIQCPPASGPDAGQEAFHSFSKGMCPTCRELVDGARIIRGGKGGKRVFALDLDVADALILR